MNDPLFPQADEYGSFYANYISLVAGVDILQLMEEQIKILRDYYEGQGEAKSLLAYAPGKWTPKEVLGHLTDTDRIMTFRALCFARGEQAELPGFDQDAYVATAHFNALPLAQLLEDFQLSRQAILALIKNLPSASFQNTGMANGNLVSVRALFAIIPGHTVHHLKVLRERY